jgi:diguanylate cyclase (GGDEF)-like protein
MTTMPDLTPEIDRLITELDAAVEGVMDWTRRILRFVVLRASPGEDVVDPMAHTLCQFGGWFAENLMHFEAIDAAAARRVERAHQAMHDAVRSICNDVLAGSPGKHSDLLAFEQSQVELLGLLARFKTSILSDAVRHDPLTGLPLRYGIEGDFALQQKDAQRNRNLLYVALIDVDHFKRINDSYGHPVGDRVLRHLAETLNRNLRSNEPIYRFGGEEFLWLMQCKSVEEAEQSAHRLLATIRTTPVPIVKNQNVTLTVTLGMAQVGDQEELASALERADVALYKGKESGRDCYVMDMPGQGNSFHAMDADVESVSTPTLKQNP